MHQQIYNAHMHIYNNIIHTHTYTYTNTYIHARRHAHSFVSALSLTLHCVSLQVLEKVSPNPREIVCNKALENPTKNRHDDFLPGK